RHPALVSRRLRGGGPLRPARAGRCGPRPPPPARGQDPAAPPAAVAPPGSSGMIAAKAASGHHLHFSGGLMRTLIFALSWLICAGGVALPALADAGGTEPHPFNAHDLHSMHRLTGPQPSPQGDQAVFVLRTTDFAANKGRTHLVRVALDGRRLTPLTERALSDTP